MTRKEAYQWRRELNDKIYQIAYDYTMELYCHKNYSRIDEALCFNEYFNKYVMVYDAIKEGYGIEVPFKADLVTKYIDKVLDTRSSFDLSTYFENSLKSTIETLINDAVRDTVRYAEIIPMDTYYKCLARGRQMMLASEITKLPPYHLTCNCFVIYYDEAS